jgi:hypothetical protein
MPTKKTRHYFIRNLDAWPYLEIFLVTAVVAVLGIRIFLQLAGYPKLAHGRLHIAHMLWGGMLMLAAVVILLTFLSKTAHRLASALGGLGFGAFIDEVGKFISADNNYFYAPSVALIYVTFVLTALAIHAIRTRPEYSRQEYLINALRQMEELALHGMDEEDRDLALLYLSRSDPAHPLVPAVRDMIGRATLIPRSRPGFFIRGKSVLRELYRKTARLPGFTAAIIVFFVAQLAVSLVYAVVLVFFFGLGWVRIARVGVFAHVVERIQDLNFVDGMQLASSLLAAIFTLLGVIRIRGSRLRAFEMFERSLLVSILFTQVFSFYQEQFSALLGLLVQALILVGVRFVIEQEELAIVEAA